MSSFANPPLKRHAALQPFSRDHYVGLVQSRHLMKAAEGSDADRRAAVAFFLDVWDQEIVTHFEDEERLLLPLIEEPAQAERLRRDHRWLREQAEEARRRRGRIDPGSDWIRALGEGLQSHIRWEERELFVELEQGASATGLDRIHADTARLEAARPRNRGRPASED